MDCYYSCQGKYSCIETFTNTSNYTFVVIIQDGDGTILYKSTDLNYAYTEDTLLTHDQALLHYISTSSFILKSPITVIVQDLTQYQLMKIPYLAVDFSYSLNGPTVVMQFNPNSHGQRQFTYQFVPANNIQMMYFYFDYLNRII